MQPRSEARVQTIYQLLQHGRKERPRHHRAMQVRGMLWWTARESAPERVEFVIEGTNHPDAVFNLRVIAVMLARGNSAACAQINFIAQKSEGRSESLTKLALQR